MGRLYQGINVHVVNYEAYKPSSDLPAIQPFRNFLRSPVGTHCTRTPLLRIKSYSFQVSHREIA